MPTFRAKMLTAFLGFFLLGMVLAISYAQSPPVSQLLETGRISVAGRDVDYRIRSLPINSFPDLPGRIAEELNARGCIIPQTYEAHRPENVIHASLERAGSDDWAALCASKGRVSLLVFFASGDAAKPFVLKEAAEIERLQAHSVTGELGFNWGIDPASPRRIHEAQAGMAHHPPPPDHDALADSTVDHQTIFHIYKNGAWERVDVE